MSIRVPLLVEDYRKQNNLYNLFLEGNLQDSDLVSEDYRDIDADPDFKIYFGREVDNQTKANAFLETAKILGENFVNLPKDVYMNGRFWHSYLCLQKRDFLLEVYPQIGESEKHFRNIVLKKFDWENYLYKALLVARYVVDYRSAEDLPKYCYLSMANTDLFNYIIKREIFRNGEFLLNMLDVINENRWGKALKAKIDNSDGKDQRYGRQVLYEMNKMYPVILIPMLNKKTLAEMTQKIMKSYGINLEMNQADRVAESPLDISEEDYDDWDNPLQGDDE